MDQMQVSSNCVYGRICTAMCGHGWVQECTPLCVHRRVLIRTSLLRYLRIRSPQWEGMEEQLAVTLVYT